MLPFEERKRRERAMVKEWGGIYPVYEVFYIHALIYAAGRADAAFRRFDALVQAAQDRAEIVAAAQEALTHTAALSRFFWPPRDSKIAIARAKKLRDVFALDESSPLRSRLLRNAIEHFDERLDRFLLEDHAGYFFPAAMVDDASLADERPGHIFRMVDPSAEIFVLLGEKHEFGPMRRIVRDILDKAKAMDNQGGRLR